MADLLAMSLACDLTRVASLQYSQALSPCVFNWLGHTEDHHTISHAAPQPYALGPNAPVTTDAEHTTAAQAEQFAVPIQKMTQGMGATGITSFGEPQFNKGAITQLLA